MINEERSVSANAVAEEEEITEGDGDGGGDSAALESESGAQSSLEKNRARRAKKKLKKARLQSERGSVANTKSKEEQSTAPSPSSSLKPRVAFDARPSPSADSSNLPLPERFLGALAAEREGRLAAEACHAEYKKKEIAAQRAAVLARRMPHELALCAAEYRVVHLSCMVEVVAPTWMTAVATSHYFQLAMQQHLLDASTVRRTRRTLRRT